MLGRITRIAALMLLAACGRKVDGVLYSTMDGGGGGKRLAGKEVLAVPASGKTEKALAKFCSEQARRTADADSLRAQLERHSRQLMADAGREQARNGQSRRWRQLVDESQADMDSARAVPLEGLSSSSKLASDLAVARATTDANGEFHLTGVPFGKVLLVATEDDDWGDVFSVGLFGSTKADLSTDAAMPGCVLGAGFRR